MSKLPRYMLMRSSPRPTKRQGASMRWRRMSLSSSVRSKPWAVFWICMGASVLGQAGIDDEVGARAAGAFIRAQEQGHAGHMAGVEAEFQRLEIEELLVQLRGEPELLLP